VSKHWAILAVGGVGDFGVWIDGEEMVMGGGFIEVENLTRMITGPQGLGFAKVAEKAMLNSSLIAFTLAPSPEMSAALSKMWDTGGIVIPTAHEKARFKLE
jgi:hypothetical protein